jgi:hypothetical protein
MSYVLDYYTLNLVPRALYTLLGHSKLDFSFPSDPKKGSGYENGPTLISNYTRAGGPFPLSIMVHYSME